MELTGERGRDVLFYRDDYDARIAAESYQRRCCTNHVQFWFLVFTLSTGLGCVKTNCQADNFKISPTELI